MKKVELIGNNDDPLGTEFYSIDQLKKLELSSIAILVIEQLGY